MCDSHNTLHDFHLYRRIEGKLFNLRRLRANTSHYSHMTIFELQYADDNALVTHTEEDLQSAVNAYSYAYEALDLTLNARKSFFPTIT